jgi:hypothetical protein
MTIQVTYNSTSPSGNAVSCFADNMNQAFQTHSVNIQHNCTALRRIQEVPTLWSRLRHHTLLMKLIGSLLTPFEIHGTNIR